MQQCELYSSGDHLCDLFLEGQTSHEGRLLEYFTEVELPDIGSTNNDWSAGLPGLC